MEITKVRPFGRRDQFGYFCGSLANDFTFTLCSGFLMKFYTDVMDVSAAVIGIMMMLTQVIDAVTDIGMGAIVDRSVEGKDGKFRPWIRRIMGPVTLTSFLMYAVWFRDMAMVLSSLLSLLRLDDIEAERVFGVMDEPLEDRSGTVDMSALDREAEITFEHVNFSYVEGQRVLSDFNLKVQPGQKVALVGATGSGKTTVVNLLMRFYRPDSGTIRINGVDIQFTIILDISELLHHGIRRLIRSCLTVIGPVLVIPKPGQNFLIKFLQTSFVQNHFFFNQNRILILQVIHTLKRNSQYF